MDGFLQQGRREGILNPAHMRRLCRVYVGVENPEVIQALQLFHWEPVGERETQACQSGWRHHCDCCGPCPFCHNQSILPRIQTMVWAPWGLSKIRAKSFVHKVMVVVEGRCHGEFRGSCISCDEFLGREGEMTREQVAALGGLFYTSGGAQVEVDHPKASWFVPTNVDVPVMVLLKDGTWGERGF